METRIMKIWPWGLAVGVLVLPVAGLMMANGVLSLAGLDSIEI